MIARIVYGDVAMNTGSTTGYSTPPGGPIDPAKAVLINNGCVTANCYMKWEYNSGLGVWQVRAERGSASSNDVGQYCIVVYTSFG